jgi:hypothetical protein
MEQRILEETETIFEHVDNDIKRGIREHDLHMFTDIAAGSVINSVMMGFRFTNNGNEAKFYKLKKLTTEAMQSFFVSLFLVFMDELKIDESRMFKFCGVRSRCFDPVNT